MSQWPTWGSILPHVGLQGRSDEKGMVDGVPHDTQEAARLSDTDLWPSKVWDAVANTRHTRKTK